MNNNSINNRVAPDTADVPQQTGGELRDTVARSLGSYLRELDGQMTTDLYQLVLSQIEPPLFEAVLDYTRGNQTRAAELLGLNRGTLRKKLRQYGIND
jgi:Fis family transcriptional regulator, factor for inversion stimulation protein